MTPLGPNLVFQLHLPMNTLWRELGRHRAPTLTPCCASLCGVSLYPSHSRRGKSPLWLPLGLWQNLAKHRTRDSLQGTG